MRYLGSQLLDLAVVLFNLHIVVEQSLLCGDGRLFGGAESKSR